MSDYEFVFKKLHEVEAQMEAEGDLPADPAELDDLEQLRQFVADISDPEPTSFTAT